MPFDNSWVILLAFLQRKLDKLLHPHCITTQEKAFWQQLIAVFKTPPSENLLRQSSPFNPRFIKHRVLTVTCREVYLTAESETHPVFKINTCLCWVFVDVSIQNKMAGRLNRTFFWYLWKGSREREPYFSSFRKAHFIRLCTIVSWHFLFNIPLLQHWNKICLPLAFPTEGTKQADCYFFLFIVLQTPEEGTRETPAEAPPPQSL